MALNQALSGINAAQADLNVISNNLANAGTTGFKGSRAEFADIYAVTGLNLNSNATGSGAELTDVAQQFGQGDIETTSNSLDLAISGNGFFAVNDGSGVTYTRAGAFQQDANGYVENASGAKLQVYPPNGSGGFDNSRLTDLQLITAQSSASATTTVTLADNLPADADVPTTTTFDPSDSTSYTAATPVTVYDSLGASHQATVYYVKNSTPENSWTTHLYVDGTEASGGAQTLQFDSSGQLTSTAAVDYGTVATSNGAAPLALSVNYASTTQFGTDYSAGTITQNGFQAGTLSSIDIDDEGVVTAYYSNDQSSQVGQVAIANFANLQGLRQIGDTSWAASADSGVAVMGTAGAGEYGSIESSSLESSNTSDTTSQLVDMIKAQRDYQANAQVLSTDNTLATALFNAVSR